MPSLAPFRIYAVSLVFIGALYFLLFYAGQQDFSYIVVGYSISFLASAFLSFYLPPGVRISSFLVVLSTLMAVFSFPALSDDVYRFLWDGHLISDGIDPLRFTPAELQAGLSYEPYTSLYPKLNSKNYHTVYPPVGQLIFILSILAGKWGLPAVVVMKAIYATIHLLGLAAITQCLKVEHRSRVLTFYGLNPLVITEGIGNLHAEVVMVGFLFVAFWLFKKSKSVASALFFALAVAAKLLPLMFLPLLWSLSKDKGKWMAYVVFFIGLIFIPFFWMYYAGGFVDSLDLYFRKFEFNAGLYYVLRWVGRAITGYNLIQWLGPMLALLALGAILKVSLKSRWLVVRGTSVAELGFVIVLLFLFSLTTLHPWYLILPLAVSAFTQYRFLWIWSYLITWTYLFYDGGQYSENYGVIGLEYLLVLILIWWEWRTYKTKKSDPETESPFLI